MSMNQLQIINKILEEKDISILKDYGFTREYFPAYADEMLFIVDHYNQYKTVPDKATFLSKFPTFELIDVFETNSYLADVLSEEYTYSKMVAIIQTAATKVQENSFDGVEYLKRELANVQIKSGADAVDLIQQYALRYNAAKEKAENPEQWNISTGLPEIDEIIHGIQLSEELMIIFARTGQGKSFILTKFLTSCWETGKNVAFISPEMSPNKIGYRFDSAYKHFNHNQLNYGHFEEDYIEYLESTAKEHKNKFLVSTPQDFNNRITVSKIRSYINRHKIEVLGIDGLSYLDDETKSRNDSRQMELTHISKGLFDLSLELGVPIIAVVQANRSGVTENGGDLELENIRDADGIAYSATKVISIKHNHEAGTLTLKINKNREGKTGSKFTYTWKPDISTYEYMEPVTDEEVAEAAVIQNQNNDSNPESSF